MSTLYTKQGQNIWKTWALMSSFFVVAIFLGWAVSWYFNSPIILIIAVVFAVIMNFFSYWYSDKIVLKISGAKPANKKEYWDLYTITENLSITAGLPMPKLFVIEDPAPNAFATGRDKEHSVVAVTTGLLVMLEKNELEGVVAHELAHIGNRDMLIATVAVVLVGFVTILSDFFLRATIFGRGGSRVDGRLQIVMIIVGIVLAILAPIVARLMHLAISRKREFLADASGAMLTRYPEGLASALEKISQHNQPMRKANHAMAHLYIANPFKGEKRGKFFTKLFMTHPPIEERTRALRGETT